MAEAGPSSAQKEPTQTAQFTYTEEEQENILADKDINIRDPILPIFDLYKITQNILKHGTQGIDPLNICRSRLINIVVPQVPHYPEMVQWCAQGYLPGKRVIMSKDATRVIISITPESIASMLSFPQEVATREWDEEQMQSLYVGQPTEIKEKLLIDNLQEKKLIAGPPYPIESFTATAIMAFTMISQVLGMASTFTVTETHLGALLFLSCP